MGSMLWMLLIWLPAVLASTDEFTIVDTGARPLMIGSLVYLSISILLCTGSACYWRTISFNNNDCSLAIYMICTATTCTWLMWLSVWMAQWHPLVAPGGWND